MSKKKKNSNDIAMDAMKMDLEFRNRELAAQQAEAAAQRALEEKRMLLIEGGMQAQQAEQFAKSYALQIGQLEYQKTLGLAQLGLSAEGQAHAQQMDLMKQHFDEEFNTAAQMGFRNGVPTLDRYKYDTTLQENQRQFDVGQTGYENGRATLGREQFERGLGEQQREYNIGQSGFMDGAPTLEREKALENQRQFDVSTIMNAPRGAADYVQYIRNLRGLEGQGLAPGLLADLAQGNATRTAGVSNGGQQFAPAATNADLAQQAVAQSRKNTTISRDMDPRMAGLIGSGAQQNIQVSSDPSQGMASSGGTMSPYGGVQQTPGGPGGIAPHGPMGPSYGASPFNPDGTGMTGGAMIPGVDFQPSGGMSTMPVGPSPYGGQSPTDFKTGLTSPPSSGGTPGGFMTPGVDFPGDGLTGWSGGGDRPMTNQGVSSMSGGGAMTGGAMIPGVDFNVGGGMSAGGGGGFDESDPYGFGQYFSQYGSGLGAIGDGQAMTNSIIPGGYDYPSPSPITPGGNLANPSPDAWNPSPVWPQSSSAWGNQAFREYEGSPIFALDELARNKTDWMNMMNQAGNTAYNQAAGYQQAALGAVNNQNYPMPWQYQNYSYQPTGYETRSTVPMGLAQPGSAYAPSNDSFPMYASQPSSYQGGSGSSDLVGYGGSAYGQRPVLNSGGNATRSYGSGAGYGSYGTSTAPSGGAAPGEKGSGGYSSAAAGGSSPYGDDQAGRVGNMMGQVYGPDNTPKAKTGDQWSLQAYRKLSPTEQQFSSGLVGSDTGQSDQDFQWGMSNAAPRYAQSKQASWGGF